MEQLRPRGPDRHGAAAGGGTTKAERLDPAESNSGAGAYPTTAGSYRHDECRPDSRPSITRPKRWQGGDTDGDEATRLRLSTLPRLKRFDIIPIGRGTFRTERLT
jgi:hypothetical protein